MSPPAVTADLAAIIHRAQSRFIRGADASDVFDPLLPELLAVTDSAYGFVGEVWNDATTGAPFLKIFTLTDISWDEATRQYIERERRTASEAMYRATFESAPVGIVRTDLEGRLTSVNRRFADMLGYAPAELAGLHFRDITLPDDVAASTATVTALQSESASVTRVEKRYRRRDGGVVWGAVTLTLLRDEAGRPQSALGSSRTSPSASATSRRSSPPQRPSAPMPRRPNSCRA